MRTYQRLGIMPVNFTGGAKMRSWKTKEFSPPNPIPSSSLDIWCKTSTLRKIGIILDYSKDGKVVGIEMLYLSKRFDISQLKKLEVEPRELVSA